jgi:hypothetical protein
VPPVTSRSCTIHGCSNVHRARGLCSTHWQQWRKTADPVDLKHTTRDGCAVEGCDRSHRARGWCELHYKRWERGSDPAAPARSYRDKGSGSIHSGRLVVIRQGHVLTPPSGKMLNARLVLFDKIGYGPHRCQWCATPIGWRYDLTADHVDGDTLNDAPSNIVASCLPCNSRDGQMARWHGRKGR